MSFPPPPCDRFFNNLMAMKEPLSIALRQCKSVQLINPELLEGAFGFLTLLGNHQEIMDTFIARTHEHWEFISLTNDPEEILKNVLGCFKELGQDRIDEVLKVVSGKEVETAIQKNLVALGKTLVKISIRYLHEVNSKIVDVPHMAKLYKMNL